MRTLQLGSPARASSGRSTGPAAAPAPTNVTDPISIGRQAQTNVACRIPQPATSDLGAPGRLNPPPGLSQRTRSCDQTTRGEARTGELPSHT